MLENALESRSLVAFLFNDHLGNYITSTNDEEPRECLIVE